MVESIGSPALWIGFLAFVALMLALDLGVFHRKAHVIRVREALGWSVVWVALALTFNALVWWQFGADRGLEFLTGYLIEKSLAVDNIFVFVIIFSALGVPPLYQHRVLFWGILSALVLRAGMIFAGTALLARFHWTIYLFGALLVATGVKLFLGRNEAPDPTGGRLMRLVRRVIPSTHELRGAHFLTIENGRRVATPLLLALVLVEISDVIFAVDSIPAIFAVTLDPFIVFTSNIFAILGLRSMFFLLAGMVERFSGLKTGLSAVLVYVGVKMLAMDWVKVPPALSLAIVAALLVAPVLLGAWRDRARGHRAAPASGRVLGPSRPEESR
ncbi:Integral membrane protein TerC [Anaeromyxobacter dehalogenans 2CP-1]|uniref:Integral membrane protein TerC n=1 Tax=Anaeromyxobacter dehalogenans (strain ATCC BAA-258 / DSM 21875 / 2CP-1) TaxID=455488 RepID=B8JBX8_ANAD2|nr:TerC family protein [Anaeromyxobacter dehalogenans]ACL63900.1 Integral membrane protein TerC [Anaeromyxobacter dehalogenans 2CP-1]